MLDRVSPYVLLVSRVMLALIFIKAGWGKIDGFSGTQAYMEAMGVPGGMLPLVILLELGGGLAILFGFLTRSVSFVIAGFSVVSALLFHFDLSDSGQTIHLMKNIAIAGGFSALLVAGPGKLSVDKFLNKAW
ncbi:DoxX family protein [Photobacterium minamisatsumaniensis]|uniref:DoxX family protein n=1 Tax=Photobacterium minamisatsumaniensis TaxID=2910233 RepID=UPI003D129769